MSVEKNERMEEKNNNEEIKKDISQEELEVQNNDTELSGKTEEADEQDIIKDEIIKALEKENKTLKERNTKLENDLKEIKDRYVRTLADIENLRKRTKKEIEDVRKYSITSLLKDFLPVVDNLKRALDHVSEEEKNDNPLVEGVSLVYKQFQDALEKNFVKSFDSLNEQFDPTKHEALQIVENNRHI